MFTFAAFVKGNMQHSGGKEENRVAFFYGKT